MAPLLVVAPPYPGGIFRASGVLLSSDCVTLRVLRLCHSRSIGVASPGMVWGGAGHG